MERYYISIGKVNSEWYCELFVNISPSGENINKLPNTNISFSQGKIYADGFQQLLVEVGNKKWYDLINKENV